MLNLDDYRVTVSKLDYPKRMLLNQMRQLMNSERGATVHEVVKAVRPDASDAERLQLISEILDLLPCRGPVEIDGKPWLNADGTPVEIGLFLSLGAIDGPERYQYVTANEFALFCARFTQAYSKAFMRTPVYVHPHEAHC